MEREDLIEKATSFFNLALNNPRGRKLVDSITWSQIIKFVVNDEPVFHLDVKRGNVRIFPGDNPNTDFYQVSRVYTDDATLNNIFKGKRDSVDAQYIDEAIKVLPSEKFTETAFIHQLARYAREEILEKKRREFEEDESI